MSVETSGESLNKTHYLGVGGGGLVRVFWGGRWELGKGSFPSTPSSDETLYLVLLIAVHSPMMIEEPLQSKEGQR